MYIFVFSHPISRGITSEPGSRNRALQLLPTHSVSCLVILTRVRFSPPPAPWLHITCVTHSTTRVFRAGGEFAKRDVKVLCISCDPLDSHVAWAKDIEAHTGNKINFPLIADADRR